LRLRIILGVSALWLFIGVVLGSQTALGMTMQGNPVELASSVRNALINWLPWIPVSLLAVWLVERFPLTRRRWSRSLWAHLAAVPVSAWVANVFIVAAFWWIGDSWQGWSRLARQAAFWGTIRIHVALTVYGASVAIAGGWRYYQEARSRELRVARLETQLANAQLQALSAQIRPHFLFNTLHTIGQLWRSGRGEEADTMLDHLGALFQSVRASTDRPEIPLAEEVAMVRDYLAIEQARFPDRLSLDISVTPEAEVCSVPPLLLQPLVENAIRHGVSASPDAGRVAVRARVEEPDLILEVEDDGPGLEHPSPSPGSGTGLANTRERLAHAYAGAASFSITSGAPVGTLVRVTLPAHTETDR